MSFAHGAHAGGSCVHKDALGNTDLDTVRGGAGLLMTKRIFFYCLLPSLDTSTWRTPQSHPLSLPFSCRQTLLFEFRCDSVSSLTPSSRLYRRRRAYSYGQSVSSRSTIRSTSEAFHGLRCSHPNNDSPQPTATRPVWQGLWDPGPSR